MTTSTPRSLEEIAASAAEWRLRFYCWRRIVTLSVATVVAGDAIASVVEGRTPHVTVLIARILEGGP